MPRHLVERGVTRLHLRARHAAVAALVLALAGCSADAPDEPATPATGHQMPATTTVDAALARQLSAAHVATARYATDVLAAEKDGYSLITPLMPGMGYHYLNPDVTDFDATKPPILVYQGEGVFKQLVALEWVWPEEPAEPPLPGATYGSFDAACHYSDGAFVAAAAEADCAPKVGDAPFTFWHPKLVTMHVWLWMHNPAGIFNGTNPLIGGA